MGLRSFPSTQVGFHKASWRRGGPAQPLTRSPSPAPQPALCPFGGAALRVMETAGGPVISVGTERRSETVACINWDRVVWPEGQQEADGDSEACSTAGFCCRSADGAPEGRSAQCVGATGPAGASRAPTTPQEEEEAEEAGEGL